MSDVDGGTFRIAFVGHKSLPANYGGVEVYAEEVGARLAALGHEVLSFTSSDPVPGAIHRGVRCHRVGSVNGKHLGALSQAFTATMAAIHEKPDIVHFMAMGPSIFAPVVRIFTRSTVVVTVNGRDDLRRKWGPAARRLMRLSFHSATKSTHGVIAVSHDLLRQLDPVARGTCVYIPNAVTFTEASTDAAALLDSLQVAERPFVLYAGRLAPEKRVEVLLRAFARLDVDADLVIAGGPAGAKGYVEMLHELGARDPRVRFIGHRSAPEVDVLMRRTAAFVLPSELEGLPLALLEALGREAPVVVSNLPCHAEVLGDGGPGATLVPVDDEDALGQAIRQTLVAAAAAKDDARERARQVRSTYEWNSVTGQVDAFYRRLVAEAGPGRRRRRPRATPQVAPLTRRDSDRTSS